MHDELVKRAFVSLVVVVASGESVDEQKRTL